ncbi:DLA4 [Auxenochlorella protothecoides x Auxenochlorella symbiontica]
MHCTGISIARLGARRLLYLRQAAAWTPSFQSPESAQIPSQPPRTQAYDLGKYACAGIHSSAIPLAGVVKPFPLAQTGEGIKECELVQWFVSEGDTIEAFDRLCEIQSDKATLEITSSLSGKVVKLHFEAGAMVQVGENLVSIETDEEAGDGDSDAGPAPSAASPAAHSSPEDPAPPSATPSRVLTSPAVRHLARQHSLDLAQVRASGPGGRLTKADVQAHLDSLSAAATSTVAADVAAAVPTTEAAAVRQAVPEQRGTGGDAAAGRIPAAGAGTTAGAGGGTTTVPLRGFRKAMVKSMAAAGAVPHFHFCEEVQMDALVALRALLRTEAVLGGAKLTYMPFFIKAAALALEQFPLVNSSLSPDQASILQHGAKNIGIAVATAHGLAVPNIKNVESKSIVEIAAELARLQAAAAANQLRPEDIRGGTFTLSNIGMVGGTYATPLVNPPEVAIMALGKMQSVPRFAPDGRSVVPQSILNISLGADHRVVDGAMLAGFAQAWRRYVEIPGKLLLEMR